MVAIQDITHMARFGAPLCQDCGHELGRDEIGTVCDLCIAEEVAGRYAGRKEKSAVDMVVWPDLMDTDDPAVYWRWLDIVDTMLAKPGEPTNLERNVMTGNAIRWAERYEEDRRKLNELYDWLGIAQDTPIAQVMGATNGIALTGR
ncbi:MAG: hypothetical protein OXI16_02360 [Chloroflexota bacterium]|nr:hypothetical protein [Chloroflexota bacterium]